MDSKEEQSYENYEVANLSAIDIPDKYISGGFVDAEVYVDEDDKEQEEECLQMKLEEEEREEIILPDDETVQIHNLSNKEDKDINFFDFPRAQIDGGAKSSVTNLLEILHNVKWYNDKFKCRVYMKGATSKKVIIPKAIGKLRVRANTVDGYLDCDCYYSPDFTTTLLSEVDVRKATRFPKQYGSQVLAKSFAIDDETLIKDLTTGKDVNLENASEYQMDYGNCKLICFHRKTKSRNVEVPGIIRSGLCYTLPLLVPDLPANDPKATIFNSSEKRLKFDKKFKNECEIMQFKLIYEHQQKEYTKLINLIDTLPEDVQKLPFHLYIAEATPINAIKQEALELLRHCRLIHCGASTLKGLHKYVDGVPDMSKFEFNDIKKCATCLQAKIHKNSPGTHSLRDTVSHPYQGLYIDMGFPGKVSYDKDGNPVESTREDVEGLNGERAWILISDAQT